MRDVTCDVAVIGAGTAGIAALRAAREAGARAVMIEQGPGGTTCARVGCMPSKLLAAAADAAQDAREAGRFGIRIDGVSVDGPAVLARVRGERDRFVASVFEGLDELPDDCRIAGRARFEGPDTLRVDDGARVRFKAAVLATGSSPSVPPPLRDLGARVVTTDTLFEIADLPASLAVVGGGPVGLEMAQAMARLGVRTALFDPGTALGGLEDPALAASAREIFGAEMDLHLEAKVERAERHGDGAMLHWDGGSGAFALVLAAAGRPPNLSGIGLDRTGARLDEGGSPAFDRRSMRCEGAPLFIAGDANADRPVLHEASRQGTTAGRNAARLAAGEGDGSERPERWPNLAMVFTQPQIALVGAAFDPDARDRRVGRASFCDQGRARIIGRDQGAVHVYADPAGRLLGAQMLGPEVEHLAHILAFAIQDGHTVESLRDRPYYHPTLEEALKGALGDLARQIA